MDKIYSEVIEVRNTDEEIKEFLDDLGKTISQYCGFDIKFPIHIEDDSIIYDLETNFHSSLAHSNDVTLDIVRNAQTLIKKSVENSGFLDGYILQNLQKDLTMSFINEEYLSFNSSQQFDFINNINDLKLIGSKTYEGKPVDIGVIYCIDEDISDELNLLNVDIIHLQKRKPIKQFFLDEKPFLRLIDNKSLAVIVNSDFEVFALMRKKSDGKSVSHILESQFNEWTVSQIKKNTFLFFSEEYQKFLSNVKENLSTGVQDDVEKIGNMLIEYAESLELIKVPNYVYFSMKNKKMEIFTNNIFTIHYDNGDWKLKHFGLLLASIMTSLFIPTIKFFHSQQENDYKQLLLKMTDSVLKLLNIIKQLSEKENSSIFTILLKNDQRELLTSSEAVNFLTRNSFNKNNIEKDFINVIKINDAHLNINDSDPFLIETIASVDGAVVIDGYLNLVSYGELIDIPSDIIYEDTFGTGTRAARYASRLGMAIKVSEDGDISLFSDEKLLLKI